MDIQNKQEQNQEKETRRNRFVRWAAVAAAAVLVAGGALGAVLAGGRMAPTDTETLQTVSAEGAESYDALYELISAAGGARSAAYDVDSGAKMEAETPAAAPAAEMTTGVNVDMPAAAEGAACPADFSETNVQVKGVDEADIVKTDGKYLYYLADNTLYITEAAGRDTRVLSRTVLGEDEDKYWRNAQEMYLLGDRLMIVSQGWSVVWIARGNDGYESGRDSTQVMIYDVSNRRQPTLLSTLGQSGSYVSSRMVGEHVYLVTSQFIYDAVRGEPVTFVPATSADGAEKLLAPADILSFREPTGSAYTVIGAINLKSGTAHESAKAVLGSSGSVYANTAHLLVAQSDYTQDVSPIAPDESGENVQITRSESSTKLVLFSLESGKIAKLASGSVPGSLLNQFSMDEYAGVFRVVTTVNKWVERIYTDGVDRYEYADENYNCLYTLDQNLAILGSLEKLADEEWVESVRFDGDVGYFVTFRQTDPLFCVDLSDPARPRILSTLKIPGFSEYLHVYGDGLLLGLGYQADEESGARQGVKLSMFGTSNKADVKELVTERLDADYTVVGSNHKAILVDAERNLIAFPADSAYYIYAYEAGKGFTLLKKIHVGDNVYDGNLRGLFIGNNFYVLSASGLTVFDMATWDKQLQLGW